MKLAVRSEILVSVNFLFEAQQKKHKYFFKHKSRSLRPCYTRQFLPQHLAYLFPELVMGVHLNMKGRDLSKNHW
jgi:hypothetical protein